MREHNVDFMSGDFNMSAFSTVGDVFTDAEFSAPGNSFLWRLGALEEPNRECAGFLIMPKRPYEWREFDYATLGLGPRDQSAHLPVFPHLRTTNLPRPSSVVCRDDVHDRAPCEWFFSHTSEVACETFACRLFLKSALTHGRIASSLCLSVSLSLCLCLCVCVTVSVCCVLCFVCCCGGRGGGGRERRRTGETNRTIWLLIPAKVSLKRAETEQLYQVKRMIGGIGDMLFSICSQTENVYDPTVSLVKVSGTK